LKVKSLGRYGYGRALCKSDGNFKQAYAERRTGMTTPYVPNATDPTAINKKIANGDYVSYPQQLMEFKIRAAGVTKFKYKIEQTMNYLFRSVKQSNPLIQNLIYLQEDKHNYGGSFAGAKILKR
jgi:hypothetical protein